MSKKPWKISSSFYDIQIFESFLMTSKNKQKVVSLNVWKYFLKILFFCCDQHQKTRKYISWNRSLLPQPVSHLLLHNLFCRNSSQLHQYTGKVIFSKIFPSLRAQIAFVRMARRDLQICPSHILLIEQRLQTSAIGEINSCESHSAPFHWV